MITINTNMASIIAQNSFNKCSTSMNRALERLSTGYKINSSKDDAAGNAIATKLETKISSYAQATKNAEMGADYLQSADSTITTMQNMVQRMRDLTEQAANGTYGDDERKALQAEVDGLTAEIYRIKNTTEFNGKKILGEEEPGIKTDVKMSEISTFAGLAGKTVGISSAADLEKFSAISNTTGEDTTGINFVLTNDIDMSSVANFTPIGKLPNSFKGVFNGNGFTISNLKVNAADINAGLFSATNDAEIKNLNLKNIEIKTTGGALAGGLVGQLVGGKVENCSVTGGSVSGKSNTGGLIGFSPSSSVISNCFVECDVSGAGQGTAGFIGMHTGFGGTIENCSASGTVVSNATGGTGGFMGFSPVSVTIKNCVSSVSSITNTAGSVGAFSGAAGHGFTDCAYDNSYAGLPANAVGSFMGPYTADGITAMANPKSPVKEVEIEIETPEISVETNLQVGIQADTNSVISIDTGFAIGYFKVDLSTDEKAQKSLASIDKLMDKMTTKKTDIGASLNRIESVLEQQNTMITSMTNALSQIKDADIAKESANYVKNQILQQTTASLLATANQNPNIALNLL